LNFSFSFPCILYIIFLLSLIKIYVTSFNADILYNFNWIYNIMETNDDSSIKDGNSHNIKVTVLSIIHSNNIANYNKSTTCKTNTSICPSTSKKHLSTYSRKPRATKCQQNQNRLWMTCWKKWRRWWRAPKTTSTSSTTQSWSQHISSTSSTRSGWLPASSNVISMRCRTIRYWV
jgi:hypothetical protein